MRGLQQIPEVLTVKATADTIAFLDPRGEWTFAITNKAAKLEINGANVEVKTRVGQVGRATGVRDGADTSRSHLGS